jgi:integrase
MSAPTALVPLSPILNPQSSILVPLAQVADQARVYVEAAHAPATLRAYRSSWADFATWCIAHELPALPAAPETVALYVSDLASRAKYATIQRRISAISQAHQAQQLETPTRSLIVRKTLAGIRRTHGTAQTGKAAAVTETIRQLVATLGDDLPGLRDRALILVGFAGAFRRSELASLDTADVTFDRAGLIVHLRRSKTDQGGQGTKKGLPYGSNPNTCPVRSLRDWLDAAGIGEGPIFRPIDRHGNVQPRRLSDRAVAEIVKKCAAAAGLDPADYAGHSLRAGLATAAAQAGVSERAIMQQTGHTSVTMVRRYIRDGTLFRENAAAGVGL